MTAARESLEATRPLKDVKATGAAWVTEAELGNLIEVAEAAQAFMRTTSVFRQVKASRAEFERLALALSDAWVE